MAEHDYVIANQNGANTRSDLNNALAAIVSNNSKATAPTTTYAFMWWADTANDILKQRNAADSAWINILTLSTGAPLATIANFTSTGIDDNATSTAITIDASENVTLTGTVNGLEINTTATSNLGLGTGAVDSITTGDYNVGVGNSALTAVTEGVRNTAIGTWALKANTTGSYNTANGYQALFSNTTGSNNIAVGHASLTANTTASTNTAIGNSALISATTGGSNAAIGYQAGAGVTTGNNNVFVGYRAGYYLNHLITGTTSTFLGSYSYPSADNSTQCIVIGHAVGGADGYTTIGHGTSDIRASHGSTTWSTVSDERYKKDITDATTGLGFVNALRPRTWNYKTLGELPETFSAYEADSTEVFKNSDTNHGFIAQEVKAAIDADSSIKDGFRMWDDRPDGSQEVAEAALIPVLVKAIQELSAKVEALENA